MELNLFNKTEIWIRGIALERTNLRDLAATAARILGLPEERVLVVDVGADHVTLDLLCEGIQAEQVLGREGELLEALGRLPGVRLGAEAGIHSEGILGLLAMDKETGRQAMRRSSRMRREIEARLSRRAIVFPTGTEVAAGMIEDTNTPWLAGSLEEAGYAVTRAGILPDDADAIAGALRRAAAEGYGLAVTTGGVGAEGKDCTVEAVLKLDPKAETRYLVHFKQGTGRHVKPGVRIAVGAFESLLLVTLPGPNDEVMAATPPLLAGLAAGADRAALASAVADALRAKISRAYRHGH